MTTEAEAALAYWRVNHIGSPRVVREGHEHRWELAAHIAAHQPESVLEFGSGSGRNLAVLRESLPNAGLVGIDPSPDAIAAGRDMHQDVIFVEGDQRALDDIADGAFDVVFCVSVLDHIPSPVWQQVYSELVRVAGKALVLLEPIQRDGDYGYREGECADLGIDASPYTYLHDYLANDPKLKPVRPLPLDLRANHYEFSRLYCLLEMSK